VQHEITFRPGLAHEHRPDPRLHVIGQVDAVQVMHPCADIDRRVTKCHFGGVFVHGVAERQRQHRTVRVAQQGGGLGERQLVSAAQLSSATRSTSASWYMSAVVSSVTSRRAVATSSAIVALGELLAEQEVALLAGEVAAGSAGGGQRCGCARDRRRTMNWLT